MRHIVVAVAVLVMALGGCSDLEDKRKKDLDEQRFSAARLGGKFAQDDPLVQMLAPEQREALRRTGMLADEEPEELAFDENGDPIVGEGDAELASETTSQQVGGAMMSVLSVVVPLGMMVVPYLLF